jgi:hypothetical protein
MDVPTGLPFVNDWTLLRRDQSQTLVETLARSFVTGSVAHLILFVSLLTSRYVSKGWKLI